MKRLFLLPLILILSLVIAGCYHQSTALDAASLVTPPAATKTEKYEAPGWAAGALAASTYQSAAGERYTLLVYPKQEGESFLDWIRGLEIADSAVSETSVETKNGAKGFAYSTNDYGAEPDLHITVVGGEYVYYFASEKQAEKMTADFLKFVEETSVK